MNKLIIYLENASWVPSWMKTSNRVKHFLYALPCGFIGGLWFVFGLALGMEFKDKQYGSEFDALDITATLLGGLPGALLHFLLFGLL